jgi:hypothetical protein
MVTIHKLMIKQHRDTKLKYLCYTRKEGTEYDLYPGSGIEWLKHLNEYGENIETTLIFETDSKQEFKKYAKTKSIEWDIVNSPEWANLKLEEGDGGDTVSNRMWITNGELSKYILKEDNIPDGWRRGRSNIPFNDPIKQSEFSKRSDRIKTGKSIKLAWDEGRFNRDHSKCGAKGDNNVSRRPDVKEKMRIARLKNSETPAVCSKCGNSYKGSQGLSVHIRRSKVCK